MRLGLSTESERRRPTVPKTSSGLTRAAGESLVQMVKEGDKYLISSHPCGPVQVSTGPHLPAHPSGRWGGLISSSHGETLWP